MPFSRMASLATIALAVAAFGVTGYLPAAYAAQECRTGTFSTGAEQTRENGTAGEQNGTLCSECNPLCKECFGSSAVECFVCVSVFVASGRERDGRPVVECLITCPDGFGLRSATLECVTGAEQTAIGWGSTWIAVLCACSVVAAALLLLVLFLLRRGHTCWRARHQKRVELQGDGAIEMNSVETNEFSYVGDSGIHIGSLGEVSTGHQHFATENAPKMDAEKSKRYSREALAAEGYVLMSQASMEEGRPPATLEVGSASKRAARNEQVDLAAQGYITMHSTASCSSGELGTGHRGKGRSKSSWLLSDNAKPEPHHSSLPRHGYSVSSSSACLQRKMVEMRAQTDSLEVHSNQFASIGRMSYHCDQMRDRTASQASSSHYEVMSGENNFPASFDGGYERIRSRCATGSDPIYWYASLDQLLPNSRSRQPTADSEYVAMRPQATVPDCQPSVDTQRLCERTPGSPNRKSDSSSHYYNFKATQ